MATKKTSRLSVEVRVELRPQVEDAEALSIQKSLTTMGLTTLTNVRTARLYTLTFLDANRAGALRQAHSAVDQLLANPVVHQVQVRFVRS